MRNFTPRKLVAGLESIQFQTGAAFYNQLKLAYEDLQTLSEKAIPSAPSAKAIPEIILNHTGITSEIHFDDAFGGPAIEIPDVHKNNPLVSAFIRNFMDNADGLRMVENANGMVKGKVSLKTSQVSGVFQDVVAKIHISAGFIKNSKMTAGELAAITLHEVGHMFTYFEYLSRTVTTNQALAGLARGLEKSATQADRETILISVKKALALKDMDARELAKNSNNTVVETVVLSTVIQETRSELGSNIYDNNNWEYLADQFANRHGAGRDLVTALDKLHRAGPFGSLEFRGTAKYYFVEALKIMAIVGALVTIHAFPGLAQLGGFAIGVVASMDNLDEGTYDRPQARLQRIRNDLVEAVKSGKYTKTELQALKEDIVVVDDILKEVTNRRALFTIIWGWVSGDQKRRLSAEKLQQELEALASNDLFLKAQELKVLA